MRAVKGQVLADFIVPNDIGNQLVNDRVSAEKFANINAVEVIIWHLEFGAEENNGCFHAKIKITPKTSKSLHWIFNLNRNYIMIRLKLSVRHWP